jgi:hypothetical protein
MLGGTRAGTSCCPNAHMSGWLACMFLSERKGKLCKVACIAGAYTTCALPLSVIYHTNMSRKRDKIKGSLGLKGSSSSLAPSPTPASGAGNSVPMHVLPTGTSHEPCEPHPMLIQVARSSSSAINRSYISNSHPYNAEEPKCTGPCHGRAECIV